MFAKIRGIECTRPGPHSDEVLHAAGLSHANHRRCHPTKAGYLAFQHIDREADRNTRVNRIAARFQNLESRLRRQGMARDHHMPDRHNLGTLGLGHCL